MKEQLNNKFHNMIRKSGLALLSAVTILGSGVALGDTSSDFDAVPPTIASGSANTDPLVMLAMSNDHQLYIKAYTDYTDLDADGVIDITYVDAFNYYGYFDSSRCYSYATSKFSPQETANGPYSHDCSTASRWSGNFLNWASMTRMDIVRKVLFGGKRSADTTLSTVLERALIPTDVHAFVKTYTTPDTATMLRFTPYSRTQISMCNVTRGNGLSETTTRPPLLRVAHGNWPGWATNETAQCLYRGERSGGLGIEPPSANQIDGDATNGGLVVRVDVCMSGLEESNCKAYSTPGSAQKPTGLLQRFGERQNSPLRFGLMTGSYSKNLSGGVLRKDISKVLGNSDSSQDEINSATGQFINQANTFNGVINTLSSFRISKYRFTGAGNYKYTDCNTFSIPASSLVEGSATRGCSNWVNPLGEIYMEALRYFSGQTSASTVFNTDDSSYIPALPAPISTWTDPLSSDNYCANCSIVAISTGLNSFDANQMGSASGITGISGAADVNTKTNTVGNSTNENINGNTFLIGESIGVSTNQQCTAKVLNGLSDAQGICPEQPTLKGGFQIAGLAHHSHTNDLRTDNITYPGKQIVNTYSISLAESLPSFTIPVGTDSVTFSPSCESNTNGGANAGTTTPAWLACSLANATIETLAADQSTGSILFHWEDSSWGNDYDMDGVERISWCVGSACGGGVAGNQIRITATTPLAAAGNALLFGYTITGSTTDGVQRVVLRPGGTNFNDLYPPVGNGRFDYVQTFTTSGSSAALLKNPLWYAAKYGSFTDTNNNGIPDLVQEWDNKKNSDGTSGSDGIPDNFFQVTNPALLETQLDKIFTDIVARTSAGSALAVLSANSSSTSTLYQALYDPLVQSGNNTVSWAGRLHSLFLDDKGHIREDSDGSGTKGKLDNYATDKIVDIFFDVFSGRTKVQRYISVDNGVTRGTADGGAVELSELQPIWNARDELASLDAASITSQRTYTDLISSSTGGGRYIFTWVDGNIDNVIDSTEVVDFVSSSFTGNPYVSNSNYFGFLNVGTKPEADNIVDFIRGKEGIAGFRSRTIEFDSSLAGDDVWRLGDIIHSTPVVTGKPGAAYDLIYGDTSYKAFADTYSERRQVVYAGANDGMLHAFNGGFFDSANNQFNLTDTTSTAVPHPLGSELWAYVPRNLLPHLKWLAEAAYPHVYYVDGEPRTYDVNIFTPGLDATTGINHPNGWGTILVVGMRLGGGNLTYDHDNDGTSDFTTRSAYIVLDVTDPEVEPNLIAEITDTNFGFTTGIPSLVVKRVAGTGVDWDNPSVNNWYLVFGSGPTDLDTVTSSQNARIYAYDLSLNSFASISPTTLTGAANSFVGDPKSVDWGSDYNDDIVYFGTVGGTNAAPTGMLHRLVLGTSFTSNTLMNPAKPFVSAPTTTIDSEGRQWVYAGSGRLFTNADSSSLTQQSSYGIKEPLTSGVPTYSGTVAASTDLQEVGTVQVFADSSILDPGSLLPSGTDTFDKLVDVIRGKDGWQRKLTYDGSDPSERSLSSSTLFKQLLLFTTYTPPLDNACVAEGDSSLFAVSFKTGTALPNLGLGIDFGTLNNTYPITLSNISAGKGIATRPVVLPGPPSPPPPPTPPTPPTCAVPPCVTPPPPPNCPAGTVSVASQDSTGQIITQCITPPTLGGGRQSWRELDF